MPIFESSVWIDDNNIEHRSVFQNDRFKDVHKLSNIFNFLISFSFISLKEYLCTY